MSNHGVVTYGTDLEDAFNRMDTVEHFAKISMYTRILGRETAAVSGGCREAMGSAAEVLRARGFRGEAEGPDVSYNGRSIGYDLRHSRRAHRSDRASRFESEIVKIRTVTEGVFAWHRERGLARPWE